MRAAHACERRRFSGRSAPPARPAAPRRRHRPDARGAPAPHGAGRAGRADARTARGAPLPAPGSPATARPCGRAQRCRAPGLVVAMHCGVPWVGVTSADATAAWSRPAVRSIPASWVICYRHITVMQCHPIITISGCLVAMRGVCVTIPRSAPASHQDPCGQAVTPHPTSP